MASLATLLAAYLKRELRLSAESSPNDTLRVFFAGPPKAQLEQLFELLTGSHGRMEIEAERGSIPVPVYLVDPRASDPTEKSLAARCTPSYLVQVRTHGEPIFLALHEVGVAMSQSLTTAVKPLGIRSDIESVEEWMQEPLIAELIEKSIDETIARSGFETARAAIGHALSKAWNADERHRDKPTTWEVLGKIVELRPQGAAPHEALAAVLGLPSCTQAEVGSKSHLQTLDRLADMFQAHGLRKGFEELEENAAENLLPHVQAFRRHVESQGIFEASEFSRDPLQIYCPLDSKTAEIPTWWQSLTVEAWATLLDSSPPAVSTGRLNAKIANPLTAVPRGMPFLVRESVELEISVDEPNGPVDVFVFRASGQSKLEAIGQVTVEPGNPQTFEDVDAPIHERFVRYKLEAAGYSPASIKVIVVDQYSPGIVVCCRGAKKATPFKLNKKAKDENNKTIQRYECDLELSGMGSQPLDFYTASRAKLGPSVFGYEVDSGQEGALERPIHASDPHHSISLIESDEECYYEFFADPDSSGEMLPYRIYLTADDVEPTGATSEFDRLVIENRSAAKREQTNARVEPANSRATNLEEWALEDANSFHPLILGPDYLDVWRKPSWEDHSTLSGFSMPVDPRPSPEQFRVPEQFASARSELLEFLRPANGEPTPAASMLRLHENMQDESFVNALQRFLDSYLHWLETEYDVAAWVDVVAIHAAQPGVPALEPVPYAVLLTPLHPVRLAWQCRAQQVLQEAVRANARCPAASMLNPSFFPDCMLLPCRTGAGQVKRHPFAAMASSSDYWGVLWSVGALGKLGGAQADPVLGAEFGISVDGLSSGFTAQQVIRALEEASRLLSAKSALRVGVSSDTSGAGSCNDGISAWCATNLGPDEDYWFNAGPRTLTVVDHRPQGLHPEQAVMASLTHRTDAAVRWFKQPKESSPQRYDLSIIAHLGTMNHEFSKQGIRSAVDPSALGRWRVRKQLKGQNAALIAESRIGEIPATVDREAIAGKLLSCVDAIERCCGDTFDSYVFAPNLGLLSSVVDSSFYTAVSSSNVDAACFFGSTGRAYLWDYELPSYARRAGENSGYFLLARETEGMLVAVQSAMALLGDHGRLEDERISNLLREISRRGMPTLKRLTTGGSMSLGEVGMLVALRVFQSDFESAPLGPGLLPIKDDDGTLNLVIPADPFKNHFEDLRIALENKQGERPDLLVLSLSFVGDIPMQCKITPVEVKARGGLMSDAERKAALSQASLFAGFLGKVQSHANETELWGIAWRSMLSTLLDYGFRVYGQLDQFMQQEEWAHQHSAALRALANAELEVEVDYRGRLIIIDSSPNSAPRDVDRDGFPETISLSHADAYAVVAQGGGPLVQAMRQKLTDWELKSATTAPSAGTPLDTPQPVDPAPPATVNAASQFETGLSGQSLHADDTAGDAAATTPQTLHPKAEPETSPAEREQSGNAGQKASDPCTGIRFRVGSTIHAFSSEDAYFFPSNTALNQLNVGIVGDLGTGKTQLIQALVYQLGAHPEANRGHRPNILIFDYKRDYTKPDFVEATGARVVSPFDMPLNLFDISNSAQRRNAWLERSKFFSDVLDKIYTGIGPAQRQRIKAAVKDSYDVASSKGQSAPTLGDVFNTYTAASGGSIDSPYSIMSDLIDGGYFVSDQSAVQPFSDFLKGVVVIDLAEVGQDDRTKNMLVVIFLNLFYEHMLRIEKKPFIGTGPQLRFIDTMLLVDEADNIMKYEFDVLKKILLQGREFGVGVLLASQFLSHFKTAHENYLEPLLSWFVHKVPNVSVKDLEGIGLTNATGDTVNTIKSLGSHECLYKTLGVDGKFIRGVPFYTLR